MILSKKTRYAIVALTRLAREFGNGPIQIRDIAEKGQIPQRFLEGILLELRKKGILGSKLGKDGGYFLLKKPSEVKLFEIIEHFEGTVSLLYCACEKSYRPCEFCMDENDCRIRTVISEVHDATQQILSKASLETLINNAAV